jgi:hypothetical protein
VPLALERHLCVVQIDLAALQHTQAGFADAAQKGERENVVKILPQRLDEGGLFGLAGFALAR